MIAMILLAATGSIPLDQAVRDSVAEDECKADTKQQDIVVCARRNQQSPYRLPDRDQPFDPSGDMKSVMNERVGWAAEGDAGTQSCSAVGLGGWTGCMVKGWKVDRDQSQWGKNAPKRRW